MTTKHTPNYFRILQEMERVSGPHSLTAEEMDALRTFERTAPDMLEALSLHQAWADSERTGPDYGGQKRDTHPDGEQIWRRWWDGNLDLCDRANRATAAALTKARGEG